MPALLWLTLGAFAIGTEGFMIAGLLPSIARDLGVAVPMAGHLVTAFSLTYAIGAPVLAVLTAGLERRRLLVLAMGGFALANLLAALAPNFLGLLGVRLLLALAAGAFMPTASGYAAAVAQPGHQGRALSLIFAGLTLAIIAGVPVGVLLGERLGWRATFIGVAVLATVSLLGILTRLPRRPAMASASLGERLAVAGRGDVLAVLAASMLAMTAAFAIYTYLGAFLGAVAGISGDGLALALLVFGLASAAGTRLGGAAADRWGPRPAALMGALCVTLSFGALSAAAALWPGHAAPAIFVPILLWGLSGWAMMTAQQARLLALAPALAPITLSLNASATYLGSASGAAIGSLVISAGAVAQIGWVAMGFGLLSALLVAAALRRQPAAVVPTALPG